LPAVPLPRRRVRRHQALHTQRWCNLGANRRLHGMSELSTVLDNASPEAMTNPPPITNQKGSPSALGASGPPRLQLAGPREKGRYTLVGTGGTLLFPEGDGTPRPGALASVGLGVDHAR
jgi:hypothetical protein